MATLEGVALQGHPSVKSDVPCVGTSTIDKRLFVTSSSSLRLQARHRVMRLLLLGPLLAAVADLWISVRRFVFERFNFGDRTISHTHQDLSPRRAHRQQPSGDGQQSQRNQVNQRQQSPGDALPSFHVLRQFLSVSDTFDGRHDAIAFYLGNREEPSDLALRVNRSIVLPVVRCPCHSSLQLKYVCLF
jgi:hypothetical protein